jgi:hypothetical protein
MNNNNPSEIAKTSQTRPEGSFLSLLRAMALIALAIGAIGSLLFMFRQGQHTPRLLLVAFTFWVLSPFVALLWANSLSKRWSALTQVTLYCVMFLVALGSLAIYGEWLNVRPAGSANAFLFVAVPPVSLLLIVLVVSIAAILSGGLSNRNKPH